ncbi:hypothetical protein BN134_1093 [Cronobacter dublinensis 1210]|uniref:AraC family transcriptional regulator n=1 Tax=Cronobacter dublinensis 1210 TaxID=1208656 RepID=A0ABM9Q4R9_9ENTR|nr:hypothetical protein BN134_1093 [Cronobacter dublinensis 1210]
MVKNIHAANNNYFSPHPHNSSKDYFHFFTDDALKYNLKISIKLFQAK